MRSYLQILLTNRLKDFSQQYILITFMPLIISCMTNTLLSVSAAMRDLQPHNGEYILVPILCYGRLFVSSIITNDIISTLQTLYNTQGRGASLH